MYEKIILALPLSSHYTFNYLSYKSMKIPKYIYVRDTKSYNRTSYSLVDLQLHTIIYQFRALLGQHFMRVSYRFVVILISLVLSRKIPFHTPDSCRKVLFMSVYRRHIIWFLFKSKRKKIANVNSCILHVSTEQNYAIHNTQRQVNNV